MFLSVKLGNPCALFSSGQASLRFEYSSICITNISFSCKKKKKRRKGYISAVPWNIRFHNVCIGWPVFFAYVALDIIFRIANQIKRGTNKKKKAFHLDWMGCHV